MQPLARRLANVDRFERLVDFRRGVFFDGQKLQAFVLTLRNTAGVLEHTFSSDSYVAPTNGPDHLPAYAERIIARSPIGAFANTPTVSPSVAFVNGGGIISGNTNTFCFNTNDHPGRIASVVWANVIYYDGNVTRPKVIGCFASRDINGVTRYRLELYYSIDISGAVWGLTTTNIPSGKSLVTRVVAALL